MDRLCRPGRRAEQVLTLLASLEGVGDGGAISELDHALQLASRAERAGADEDVVLAGLLHDIGKVFGDAGTERSRLRCSNLMFGQMSFRSSVTTPSSPLGTGSKSRLESRTRGISSPKSLGSSWRAGLLTSGT